MKTLILVSIMCIASLQAGNVVKYDVKEVKKPAISKPNYPSTDLYSK